MNVTIIDQQSRPPETDAQTQDLARQLHALGVRSDTVYSRSSSEIESLILQYSKRKSQNIYVIGEERSFQVVFGILQRFPIEAAIALISNATSPSALHARTSFSSDLGLVLSQRRTLYQSIGVFDDVDFTISPISYIDPMNSISLIISPSASEMANHNPSLHMQKGDSGSTHTNIDLSLLSSLQSGFSYKKMTVAPFLLRLIVGQSWS